MIYAILFAYKSDNVWRLTFTNFEGTSTGNIEFNTELLTNTSTSIEDIEF